MSSLQLLMYHLIFTSYDHKLMSHLLARRWGVKYIFVNILHYQSFCLALWLFSIVPPPSHSTTASMHCPSCICLSVCLCSCLCTSHGHICTFYGLPWDRLLWFEVITNFSCSVCYYVAVYEEYGMSCGDYTIIFYTAAARSWERLSEV